MRRAWREDIKYRKTHKKKGRGMDPNEALRQIRLLAKQLRVDENVYTIRQHANDLAEAIEGLDEWIAKGGFLPTDWVRERALQSIDVEEPEFVLAVHKDIDADEDECDGSLGQTLWGFPKCQKCDKPIREIARPDVQSCKSLIYGLVIYTDRDLLAIVERMKESVHEESASQDAEEDDTSHVVSDEAPTEDRAE